MWKTAIFAGFLGLAASPTFAADTASAATRATASLAPGALTLDRAGIEKLTDRVSLLEKRLDQLGVPEPAPAPTAAELKHARLMEAAHQEFLNQVWSAP